MSKVQRVYLFLIDHPKVIGPMWDFWNTLYLVNVCVYIL